MCGSQMWMCIILCNQTYNTTGYIIMCCNSLQYTMRVHNVAQNKKGQPYDITSQQCNINNCFSESVIIISMPMVPIFLF